MKKKPQFTAKNKCKSLGLEENIKLELREKTIDKLDDQNSDLNIENIDWSKRPNLALFSKLENFKWQNLEDFW